MLGIGKLAAGAEDLLPRHQRRHRGLLRRHSFTRPMDRVMQYPQRLVAPMIAHRSAARCGRVDYVVAASSSRRRSPDAPRRISRHHATRTQCRRGIVCGGEQVDGRDSTGRNNA